MSKPQDTSLSSLPQPTYRYITKPPLTLQISVSDLLTYVPTNWIQEEYIRDQTMIEVSCADILQSHIPRVSVERLQKLIPQALHIPEEVDPTTKILLPTTPLALAYRLITEREDLVPPIAPKSEEVEKTPQEEKPPSQFFASLPSFVPKPSSPSDSETSTSSTDQHNLGDTSSPAQSIEYPPVENAYTHTSADTVLDKQHLITPLSRPLEPLSNESQLQALLLTDEQLSIHRVLDLCSQLPGVNVCMLARGWEVVASSQLPGNLNPVALSSQATDLLEGIQAASTKMGLGALEGLTLFSAIGPVSFLQHQDLCFFILHNSKDRGFVPGVKERLQRILAELNKSRLFLPPPSPTNIEQITESQTPPPSSE